MSICLTVVVRLGEPTYIVIYFFCVVAVRKIKEDLGMRGLFFSLILLASFGTVNATMIPGSTYSYGNWTGAAYVQETTGLFSHCAISAGYLSGDSLLFSVNRDMTISVGVINPNLNLAVGQEFPVALYVDRRQPIFGTATAISSDFAVLHIQEFDRAMESFRRGFQLTIQSPLGTGVYSLEGTFRALDAAMQCARSYQNHGVTARGQGTEVGLADRTTLFQIATEMISELQLGEFRYLSAAESRDITHLESVLWISESTGISGGVFLAPAGQTTTLRETDGGDINYITSNCEGEIATTARDLSAEVVDAREIRTLCVQGDSQTESRLTKFFVGDQILYVLLSFEMADIHSEREERRSVSEGVVVRAASYVESTVGFD